VILVQGAGALVGQDMGREDYVRGALILLTASFALGQTQVDLKSQSKNIDFSGASAVKPVPVGTALPATCSSGGMFFKSDALPGSNLYGCVAANTWTLQGGATAGADFTDFRGSATATVFTVESGRVNFSVNGLPVVLTLGPATITRTGGSDTGNIWVYADYNAGSPVLRCAGGSGINLANYGVSSGFAGSACTTGSAFPANSIPLVRVDVDAGLIQPPVDHRGLLSRDPVLAGAGLTLMGNVLSVSGGAGTPGGVKRVTYAGLPGCSSTELNTEFLFTDGVGLAAHCDGISYAYFYHQQPVVLPGAVSGFTKVNNAGAQDITNDQGGLYVHAEPSSGNNLVTAVKALGGATDIRVAVVFGSGGGDLNACGLVLTDGTAASDKVTMFGRQAQSGGWVSQILNYSSYTVDVGGTQRAVADSGSPVWLRVVIGSGNHTFYVSGDGGRSWEQVGSQAEYETATHYGVGCDAQGVTSGAGMLVVSLLAQ